MKIVVFIGMKTSSQDDGNIFLGNNRHIYSLKTIWERFMMHPENTRAA